MKLLLLLGEKRKQNVDRRGRAIPGGEELLQFCLERNSIGVEQLVLNRAGGPFHYCYLHTPASRSADREAERSARMLQLREQIQQAGPFQIIGFGWAACDTLFPVGKSGMKDRIECAWPLVPDYLIESIPNLDDYPRECRIRDKLLARAYLTYDPFAALYDPNLAVDISRVLEKAAKKAGIETKSNLEVPMFNWLPFM
jgi:hypothetical protein